MKKNYGEVLADGQTVADLIDTFAIKTIDLALQYAMTPAQAAAKACKKREADEKKRKAQREQFAKFQAIQAVKIQRCKEEIVKSAAEEAEEAEEEEDIGDEAEEAEEAARLARIEETVVNRDDSLGSLCGKAEGMSIQELVDCSVYDASLKITDRRKIEMLMCEIRYYREALKRQGEIYDFNPEDALAEQKSNPEVAVPTGSTQQPWDDITAEETAVESAGTAEESD